MPYCEPVMKEQMMLESLERKFAGFIRSWGLEMDPTCQYQWTVIIETIHGTHREMIRESVRGDNDSSKWFEVLVQRLRMMQRLGGG